MKTKFILLTLFFIISQATFSQPDPGGYKVGDMAGDFKLINIDGRFVSLSDFNSAKGFIVVFTCNHCPFAQAYEQRIIDLHKKYEPLGYPVIAINSNDSAREPDDNYANMQTRAKEKNYPFVYLNDQSQEIAKIYGAARTPHVFILNKTKKGNRVEYIGTIDDNYEDASAAKVHYVDQAILELASGKKVTTKTTKAIGCGIKWRKA